MSGHSVQSWQLCPKLAYQGLLDIPLCQALKLTQGLMILDLNYKIVCQVCKSKFCHLAVYYGGDSTACTEFQCAVCEEKFNGRWPEVLAIPGTK